MKLIKGRALAPASSDRAHDHHQHHDRIIVVVVAVATQSSERSGGENIGLEKNGHWNPKRHSRQPKHRPLATVVSVSVCMRLECC